MRLLPEDDIGVTGRRRNFARSFVCVTRRHTSLSSDRGRIHCHYCTQRSHAGPDLCAAVRRLPQRGEHLDACYVEIVEDFADGESSGEVRTVLVNCNRRLCSYARPLKKTRSASGEKSPPVGNVTHGDGDFW